MSDKLGAIAYSVKVWDLERVKMVPEIEIFLILLG